MSDQDLRLRVERAASPHAAWAALLAGYRLVRGSAGGLPLLLGEGEGERCCTIDALAQVALGWPRGASSATQAARLAAVGRAVLATLPPEGISLLAVVDSWGTLQGRELLGSAAWPVVAEFCLAQDGEASLACLHALSLIHI
eukprot:6183011-Alexandrium_andersonii.AAC.1